MKTSHALLPHWQDRTLEEKIDRIYGLTQDLYYYVLQNEIKQLDAMLASYRPFDEKERKDVKTIREMLSEHPNLFNKNCEIGHLTGSALVIDPNRRNLLLHRHKTLRDKWLQFGGHPEYELDFSQVAFREASEESGLSNLYFFPRSEHPIPVDIDVHTIPASNGRPEHLHLDLRYILATDFPKNASLDEAESDELLWISFEDLEKYNANLDYPLRRLILKASKLLKIES